MRISFTGTGCSGKSTLLELCREYYGDRFQYVTEITRPIARKGLTINEQGGDDTQKAIIDAHLEYNELDDVIMDRCIVDGYIYTTWLFSKGKVSESVYAYAWNTLNEIVDNLDIIFHTAPVEMKDDGVRSTSRNFQQDIHEMTMELLNGNPWFNTFNGKVIFLDGDVDKRFNDIKLAIEQHEHSTT